jgi:hypothetical protein
MKNVAKGVKNDDLRDHYDFSGGVRGKHAKRYAGGTNVVLLAPDVYKVFRDAEAVNNALRGLIDVAKRVSKESKKKVAKSA